MRQIIRLTENDLHRIILEAAKYSFGRVPNEGNGMVGGTYGSATLNGYTYFPWEDLPYDLVEAEIIAEDEQDGLYDYLAQFEDDFVIDAELEDSWDESTNYYGDSVTPDEECLEHACKIIREMDHPALTPQAKEFAIQRFRDFFNEDAQSADIYTWEEPDDPTDYDYRDYYRDEGDYE